MPRRILIGLLCITAIFSQPVLSQTNAEAPDLTIAVEGVVKHVSFSADGEWVIVGYAKQDCDGCPGAVIEIFDISTGRQIYTFEYDGAGDTYLEVALSPDKEYLFANTYYNDPYNLELNRISGGRLWTVESGARLLPQDVTLLNADWNPNNQLLLWYDDTLMWVGQQIKEMTLDERVYHALWSPDFETVYAFAGGSFYHIDLRNGDILCTTSLAAGGDRGFRGFDDYFVYIVSTESAEIWTVESGEPEKVYETGPPFGYLWMDRGYLFWDMGGDSFRIFDNATGEVIYSLNYREELDHNGWMSRLDAYHDHVIYAIEGFEGPCPTYIYDVATEETTTVNANFLVPHPTEPLVLAYNCEPGTTEYLIYDLETAADVAKLTLPQRTWNVPLWNGQAIAAWDEQTVYVWSIGVE